MNLITFHSHSHHSGFTWEQIKEKKYAQKFDSHDKRIVKTSMKFSTEDRGQTECNGVLYPYDLQGFCFVFFVKINTFAHPI